MGVPRAFPHLKMRQRPVNISNFKGSTIALDVMGYVVKGHYRMMKTSGLADDNTLPDSTPGVISSVEDIVRTIVAAGCVVYLVADGKKLPKKAKEHAARAKKRENDLVMAESCFQLGLKKEAKKYLARSTVISPATVDSLKGIAAKFPGKCFYFGALFEADSQLGYLAQNNLCDLVISHDSDMLLFGCPKVLFTMNTKGWGFYYEAVDIPTALGWKKYSYEKFLKMMILAKCDYVKNIAGIGIARAQKIIESSPDLSITSILKTVTTLFPDSGIPDDYATEFDEAYFTYLYSAIVDPMKMESTRISPPPLDLTEEYLSFAGYVHSREQTLDIVLGNIYLDSGRPSRNVTDPSNLDELFPPECFFNSMYEHKKEVLEFDVDGWEGPSPNEDDDEDDERPKKFDCVECDKTFDCLSRLLYQTVTHTNLKAFSCHLCKRTFGYRQTLELHMRIHGGVRKSKCDICGLTFTRQDILTNHMAAHNEARPFQCDQCPKTFKTNSCLHQHKEVHLQVRRYQCENCDLSFKRIRELESHKSTVHYKARPFKCDKCEKDFTRKDYLEQHCLAIHTSERPFVCEICNKTFNDSAGLRKHAAVHSEAKPFRCDICPNMTYKRSDHLTRHMKDTHPAKLEEFMAKKKKAKRPPATSTEEPKKKKPLESTSKANIKIHKLSPQLAKLVGQSMMSQIDIVNKINDIVEEKQLYDPNNHLYAFGDQDLVNVLGVLRFKIANVFNLLNRHLE